MSEDKDNSQSVLPDSDCIIISKPGPKGGRSIDILSLDEYFKESDINLKKSLYLKAIEQYGQSNVRYCKIVKEVEL